MTTELDDRLHAYARRWNAALPETLDAIEISLDRARREPVWTVAADVRSAARGRRRTRRVAVAALAAVVLVGGAVAGWSTLDRAAPRPGPAAALAGQAETVDVATPHGELIPVTQRVPAPALDGPLLDGSGQYALADGGRVTVVLAWGTWCGPCRVQATRLQVAVPAWRSGGVDVVGFAVDETSRSQPLAFAASQGLTYPLVWDPAATVARPLVGGLAAGYPITLLVDRHRDIAAVYVGIVADADLAGAVTRLAAGG